MSPIELTATVDATKDLSGIVFDYRPNFSSTVNGATTYWLLRDKYCPDQMGNRCFDGDCEFAKKYPGSGKAKPCLEYVRKIEAAKSLTILEK